MRDERNDLNSKLPIENGRPCGNSNGKKFYYGIRRGEITKIFIENGGCNEEDEGVNGNADANVNNDDI